MEQKLNKLEDLATQIENGTSLEQSIEIFEQGVKLADECMQTLNDCKGKLVVLQEKVRRLTDEK